MLKPAVSPFTCTRRSVARCVDAWLQLSSPRAANPSAESGIAPRAGRSRELVTSHRRQPWHASQETCDARQRTPFDRSRSAGVSRSRAAAQRLRAALGDPPIASAHRHCLQTSRAHHASPAAHSQARRDVRTLFACRPTVRAPAPARPRRAGRSQAACRRTPAAAGAAYRALRTSSGATAAQARGSDVLPPTAARPVASSAPPSRPVTIAGARQSAAPSGPRAGRDQRRTAVRCDFDPLRWSTGWPTM